MNKFIYNTSEKGKKAIKIRWEKYHKKFIDRLNKSKNDINYIEMKSMLCGYLAGDGSVYIYRDKNKATHYNINFYPDNLKVAKIYMKNFSKIYGIKPKIKKDKNYYKIQIKNKIIYSDLISIMQFGSLKWRVPFNFLITQNSKREWLKAFFDSEAYVGKKIIQVQSVNKKGLEEVKKMLEEFEIGSKIYKYERKQKKWNTNYLLSIMKKESRAKFLEKIGFNHNIKSNKLKKYLYARVA